MTINDSSPILIKATREGLLLVPHGGASLEAIMALTESQLDESRDFFNQSQMVVDLRARPLSTDELSQLHGLLVRKSRVKVVEVRLTDELSFFLSQPSSKSAAFASRSSRPAAPSGNGAPSPLIVRNTCRSGTRIVSPSDCLILGDVNPGAEIVAVGDIIVFGILRGLAHAGASGDRSARIWALSIEPNQLRIADHVGVPPKGDKSTAKRYEIAEVLNNGIEIISM